MINSISLFIDKYANIARVLLFEESIGWVIQQQRAQYGEYFLVLVDLSRTLPDFAYQVYNYPYITYHVYHAA